jgi:hypothetical protein
MTNQSFWVPWIRVYGGVKGRWICVGASSHDGTPQWGDDKYPNAGYFVGKMDDLRLYNRALSSAEVRALYLGSVYAYPLAIQLSAPQTVGVTWQGAPNAVYQTEYSSDPSSSEWLPLSGPVAGQGLLGFSNATSTAQKRFYRVRVLP